MTLRKISKYQPENFEFTLENLEEAKKIINKYPAEKPYQNLILTFYLDSILLVSFKTPLFYLFVYTS